jgi:serine/threonine protein kinase
LDYLNGYPLSPTSTVGTINSQLTDGSNTFVNSSLSPRHNSTAPTSVELNGKLAATAVFDDGREPDSTAPVQKLKGEALGQVPRPSVYTAEATANAKSFLEARFNALFSERSKTPRDARLVELEARLSTTYLNEKAQDDLRRRWLTLESNDLRLTRVSQTHEICRPNSRRSSSMAAYVFTKTLGKGSFGVVRLARRRPATNNASHYKFGLFVSQTPEVCAVKIIRKSDMLRNTQEAHIKAERDVLAASSRSRWIVPLLESFQDRTNLYLVMEFMVGGDFLGLLIRWDKLEERHARFYIAEMVLCVEEAHRLGYIHRDVKPDNFLVSASGHLKISDFGLAFDGHWSHDQGYYNYQRYSLLDQLGITITGDETDREESQQAGSGGKAAEILISQRDRSALLRHALPSNDEKFGAESVLGRRNRRGMRNLARSVVGTSQYMAPEVIRGDEYDGRCDWWSIGIILFEVSGFERNVALLDSRADNRIVSLRGDTIHREGSAANQSQHRPSHWRHAICAEHTACTSLSCFKGR